MNYFLSFTLCYVELLLSDDVATHPLSYSHENEDIAKKGLSFEMNKDERLFNLLVWNHKMSWIFLQEIREHIENLISFPWWDSFAKMHFVFT